MLTQEEVRHVAMLARLGLTDDEIEGMRVQLEELLDYIAMLDEVDTSTVEPTAQILAQTNIMRADFPRPSLSLEDVLKNAPRKEGDFFRVPAVMEDTSANKATNSDGGAANA